MAYMDNIPTVYLEQGKGFISGHPKKTITTTTTIMYITIPHKLRADRNCATKFNGEYNPPQMGIFFLLCIPLKWVFFFVVLAKLLYTENLTSL